MDWARASLRAGDGVPAVAAAYARLRELAGIRREEENRAFADLLRDWNAGGAGGDEALPIERVLDSIVAPLAAHAPVLLLVLDGLSFAVARPLVADIGRQGWTELSPAGRASPPPLVAALPTVTEISRTSLLSGRLVRGNAAAERTAFGAHQRLREMSRAGKPPLLFHKADLGAGPELDERVRSALSRCGSKSCRHCSQCGRCATCRIGPDRSPLVHGGLAPVGTCAESSTRGWPPHYSDRRPRSRARCWNHLTSKPSPATVGDPAGERGMARSKYGMVA